MQTRLESWPVLTALAVIGAGCTITGTASDEDARSARLPTGVTLLESDRNQCAGAVAIDERRVSNGRRSDLVIQRGENATFEIDDDDEAIEWTCVGANDTARDTIDCPEDTSHVRITRATTGSEFLLECYGDRG
jgi:hypothetical protein